MKKIVLSLNSLILFFALVSNAGAIGFVQLNSATPQRPQSSVTVTYKSVQVAGDLNVVVVGWNDSTAVVTSVTDTKGNVYQLAVGPTVQTVVASQSIYFAKNIAGATANGNAVRVQFNTAARYADIRILEYSGLDGTNPVDVVAAGQGNSSTSNSGAVTTGNANDLLFAANLVQTSTRAAGTGFTSRIITSPNGDIAKDRIVSATGSYSATARLTSAGGWIMQMVAFKAGSASPSPDLTISKTHTGIFTQGQTGAAYTITVTNSGSASTSGTVTVTDTLPTGLTATALSGTGWSCTLGTLTCTRSIALAPSASYPAITLTVNVASNAPATVTNTATLSGGGDTNIANNTASDVVVISTSTVNWPLRISASGRYFEDQSGVPFLVVADAGWELVTQITDAQAITYLDDRMAKGFNAVEIRVIGHSIQKNAPNDYYNNAPFTNGQTDWSVRNEAYWRRVDTIVSAAKDRGMVVLMFPSYLGYGCGSEGWCADMLSQTNSTMSDYGTWIGARYAAYGNIIWMRGGDADCVRYRNACARDAAMGSGVRAGFPGALFSVEPYSGQIGGIDSYTSGTDINGVYTYGSPQSMVKRAYDASSKPFMFQEGYYENEHRTGVADQNSQLLITFLGGGLGGAIFGSCPLWSFGAGTSWCDSSSSPFNNWINNLDSPGSVSSGNIGNLMRSRRWWGMVPDYSNTVVTSFKGSELSYKATARETTGKTVIVWNPTKVSVTVDMTKISGTQANVWWYNPDDNSSVFVGTYPTTRTRNFTPGSARKVLVLDDESLNLAAPGTTIYID